MIRINLLPASRANQASSGSQAWLIAVVVFAALEIIGCFVLYGNKQQQLEDWGRKNKTVETEIKLSQEKVADHPNVKAKLAQLKAREDAIARLQSARTGPTAAMLEVAHLLSKGRGPSVAPERLEQIKNDDPLAMYNPQWDPRRLWLSSFVEDSRTVRLTGSARDGEDVSELARRMNLSVYFYDVRLLPGKKESTAKDAVNSVSFQLEARVRY
ncbi:MAG TPA: PilN domain-containing protein [Polyangiaceae bacterium]|nr:PilN domain-containing protein [Polyangiaceae bacterium]